MKRWTCFARLSDNTKQWILKWIKNLLCSVNQRYMKVLGRKIYFVTSGTPVLRTEICGGGGRKYIRIFKYCGNCKLWILGRGRTYNSCAPPAPRFTIHTYPHHWESSPPRIYDSQFMCTLIRSIVNPPPLQDSQFINTLIRSIMNSLPHPGFLKSWGWGPTFDHALPDIKFFNSMTLHLYNYWVTMHIVYYCRFTQTAQVLEEACWEVQDPDQIKANLPRTT